MSIQSLLTDIEHELKQLQLWEDQHPPLESLASNQPFCIDTLAFPQWIQFVFLPKMKRLIRQQQPLPARCKIAPMVNEYFRSDSRDTQKLEAMFEQLDALLSNS